MSKVMRKIGLLFLCSAIVAGVAVAAAPPAPVEIKAETDKQELTTDDLLTCKIIITSSRRNLAAPALPDFKGFTVVSQAQSSTVTLKESAVNSVLVYAFVLLPVETGSVTIGPATLTVEGREYSSKPLTVTVKPGSSKPAVPQSDLPRYSL